MSEMLASELDEVLAKWARDRDAGSRDRIMEEFTPLVRRIAHQYFHPGCQVEDLIQVGSIGLLRALDRYDLAQGTSFRTYASHFVVGEIKHFLRDQAPLIRVPRELSEASSKIRNAKERLAKHLGREPSEAEIAAELQLSVEKVGEVRQADQTSLALSLDQELGPDTNSRALGEQVEDKKYVSFQLAQEDRILVAEAMAQIKAQSRQVIEFAFYQDLTQTEIAKKLGISQMQVSRRLRSAIKELWELLNTRVTPW